MRRIDALLKETKWVPRDNPDSAGIDHFGQVTGEPVVLDGVSIEIAESRRADWEATVIALILALREEGIVTNGTASPDADPAAIHVKIGGKPERVTQQAHQVDQRGEARQGQRD